MLSQLVRGIAYPGVPWQGVYGLVELQLQISNLCSGYGAGLCTFL